MLSLHFALYHLNINGLPLTLTSESPKEHGEESERFYTVSYTQHTTKLTHGFHLTETKLNWFVALSLPTAHIHQALLYSSNVQRNG